MLLGGVPPACSCCCCWAGAGGAQGGDTQLPQKDSTDSLPTHSLTVKSRLHNSATASAVALQGALFSYVQNTDAPISVPVNVVATSDV